MFFCNELGTQNLLCEKSRQLSYRPTTYYWPPLKFVHRSYRNLLSYWIGLSILNKRKLKRINPSKHHCRNYNEELNLLQEPELVDPMIQTFPPRHHSGFRWPHNPQSPRVTLLSLEIGLQRNAHLKACRVPGYVRRDKQISSMVALDVLRDGQMRIALGSARGAEIYLELAMATNSTARMKVVCIQSLGKWKVYINIM